VAQVRWDAVLPSLALGRGSSPRVSSDGSIRFRTYAFLSGIEVAIGSPRGVSALASSTALLDAAARVKGGRLFEKSRVTG